ncbi:MAG: phospholipid carrier-dependent glycosyltransferase [Candidatus Aenigmarchaeota archaeon]|nr:phospholipid carrier-dependent glycosyltransferase [Candidatus Aenigmarchaeota archaeon]
MKVLPLLLMLLLLAGLGARLWGLGDGLIWRDEGIAAIAGIKLHHANPYDARYFSSEHPPVGRWLIGLPSAAVEADYADVLLIQPHLFAFTFLTPWKEVTVPMRAVVALFGVLAVLFLFLLGRELFGTEAGLWAGALAAVSVDFVAYSRILYTDMFALAFSVATMYCFVKYRRAPAGGEWKTMGEYLRRNQKFLYLLGTLVFFVLALGSRLLYPLFVAPVLVLAALLSWKGWKDFAAVAGVVLIGLIVFLQVVYPPELQAFAFKMHYGVGGYEGFARMQFSAARFVPMLFLRNSYASAFALVIAIAGFALLAKNKPSARKPKAVLRWVRAKESRALLIAFLVVPFLIYLFTRYGTQPSYTEFMHLPLFILGGWALARARREVKVAGIALLLLAVAMLVMLHPAYADYANFGARDFVIQNFEQGYDPQAMAQQVIAAMGSLQGPFLSNEQSILYKTAAEPLPPGGFPDCTTDYLDRFVGGYLVYRGSYTSAPTIQEDQLLCPLVKGYALQLERSFSTADPEDRYPIHLYRIGPRAV